MRYIFTGIFFQVLYFSIHILICLSEAYTKKKKPILYRSELEDFRHYLLFFCVLFLYYKS